jgi:hypothetical protein
VFLTVLGGSLVFSKLPEEIRKIMYAHTNFTVKVSFLAREREFFVPNRATWYRTVTSRE